MAPVSLAGNLGMPLIPSHMTFDPKLLLSPGNVSGTLSGANTCTLVHTRSVGRAIGLDEARTTMVDGGASQSICSWYR